MKVREALRRPGPWAALSGLGLFVALCVPHAWPGWTFWGPIALSCVGAAGWAVVTTGRDES